MKEKLATCITYQDSYEVFSNTNTVELHKFISALQSAKEFINLTMRDEFLLGQAEAMFVAREYRQTKSIP